MLKLKKKNSKRPVRNLLQVQETPKTNYESTSLLVYSKFFVAVIVTIMCYTGQQNSAGECFINHGTLRKSKSVWMAKNGSNN